jgi:polysaccharide pyruvyl transferase WcaK-like protein
MISKVFMESIGFDARQDRIYPDIAFRLPAPPSTRPHDDERQPLTIGVGVMAYCGWRNDAARGAQIYDAYLQKMASFVVWLLDHGHLVRVLMGDQADRRAVEDLLRAVRWRRPERAAHAVRFAPAQTLHDVMQQMADTDLVVATRYHNVVCALRMGKPTVSIGYSVKNDALLAAMGLADCCQSIERLDLALLETQTLRLIAERAAIAARIRRAVARFDRRLREQEDLLLALMLGDPGTAPRAAPLAARDPVA